MDKGYDGPRPGESLREYAERVAAASAARQAEVVGAAMTRNSDEVDALHHRMGEIASSLADVPQPDHEGISALMRGEDPLDRR